VLKARLSGIGIEYRHAPELGGKPARPVPEQRDFIASMLPVVPGTCLMCSEGDYRKCHGHSTLALLFTELGIGVYQILLDGSVTGDRGDPEGQGLAGFPNKWPPRIATLK